MLQRKTGACAMNRNREGAVEIKQNLIYVFDLQIGQMAVYLCSWGGASVTGSVMMMDGGYTAQ